MNDRFSSHNIPFASPWWTMYEKDTWYALSPAGGRPGSGMFMMDSLGQVLLVQLYRYPLDRVVLEIPRGWLELEKDKSARDCAVREAQEETGVSLANAEILDLGLIHPDDGILAVELQLFGAILDRPFEKIEVQEGEIDGYLVVQFDEMKNMILRSEIADSFTIAACMRMEGILASRRENCD